ncbi:uroporphyrinogen-III synthase [Georgenia faecalis]|uniref:Uroporphyrinogen-III synthase n=1 Tax=Georgenia faecalis TaxID=2483799 RepID=A0ABV9D711_9MICO
MPRTDPDDAVVAAVRAAGGEALPVALVRTVPAPGLDDALDALVRGEHAWLALTSPRALAVLAGGAAARGIALGALTARVAAVGPGTAAALRGAGARVDLVPAGRSSAADLLAAWPVPPAGRVLVPRSALAGPTLVDGLRARGWEVDDVVAYTTVPAPADPGAAAELRAGRVDVVLLTSGSTAAALLERYGPPGAVVVAIGEPTARAARGLGLRVDAVAHEQTPAGLVRAAAAALTSQPTDPRERP